MSEIEKVKKYIDRTKMDRSIRHRYCMCIPEMYDFYRMSQSDPYSALCLIFDYGRAKGYRAAKAEDRA